MKQMFSMLAFALFAGVGFSSCNDDLGETGGDNFYLPTPPI